jgi:hypothetical protein
VLKPGHKITRTISLLKELPGMSRLTSGTYVFEQPVTFKPADRKGATLQGVHVRLTYTIDKVAPLSFAPADGWYDQTYIHLQGSSDPSQAWTSNRPFDPTEQAPALPAPPTLDEGGVLVIAWEVVRATGRPLNEWQARTDSLDSAELSLQEPGENGINQQLTAEQRERFARRFELGVLAEDPLVQRPEIARGVGPKLVGQDAARALERRERIGGTAGAVEREDQLLP